MKEVFATILQYRLQICRDPKVAGRYRTIGAGQIDDSFDLIVIASTCSQIRYYGRPEPVLLSYSFAARPEAPASFCYPFDFAKLLNERKQTSMKVKLGIIGTGIAARELHLPSLMELKDKFEIACVCNHTEPKAKEFSAMAGDVPYVLDYNELLAREDVKAVDIILPIPMNCKAVLDSLEAGKHVIVEKPIASNLDDAQLMITFPQRFDRVMMVAENYRYNPVFERAKEIIREGKIGEPYSVFWDQFTVTDSANKYAGTAWRIDHKYPGGFVMDAGIHNIAVLRDLFGEMKSGIAFNRSVNPTIGRMDSMSLQFVFESGVNGVLNIYFSAQGITRGELTVLGKEASLVVVGNTLTIKRQGHEDISETVETDRGYRRQLEDFYEAIVNHKPPVSTFEEAFKDFRTMLMALDSAMKWEELNFAV